MLVIWGHKVSMYDMSYGYLLQFMIKFLQTNFSWSSCIFDGTCNRLLLVQPVPVYNDNNLRVF